jgi:MFS family permease
MAVLGAEFRQLWAASAVSNLGDGVALVAAPLLAAALTGDPALVAGLALAQRLPWLLFPLLSGALADRIDRRRAMVAVAACRAGLIGALGVAVLLDLASLPLLYAAFFLLSTGETLFDTAAATVLPAVVRREALPEANARLSGTLAVTNQFLGPPLGGVLFAVAAALPFLAGAGGLAVAAALIAALRGTFAAARADDAPPPDLRAEIAAGIGWLWRHRLLRTLALTLAVLNVMLVAQVSIMVLFARERLGLGPAGYGTLLTAYGLGGLLGSVIAGRVVGRLGTSRVLRLAVIIEAAVPAAIALSGHALLVGAALALFGCHATVGRGPDLAAPGTNARPAARASRARLPLARIWRGGTRRAARRTARRDARPHRPLLARRARGSAADSAHLARLLGSDGGRGATSGRSGRVSRQGARNARTA